MKGFLFESAIPVVTRFVTLYVFVYGVVMQVLFVWLGVVLVEPVVCGLIVN